MFVAPEAAPLVKRLISFIIPGGGVPYYKGGGPSAEPSLLALLALQTASRPGGHAGPGSVPSAPAAPPGPTNSSPASPADGAVAEPAKSLLAWASGLQNADGSVGLDPAHRDQGLWLTALAAIVFHHYVVADRRDLALGFVASLKSATAPNDPRIRQDNALVGWPWVPGTFGWVEPTAWSVVALGVYGRSGDARAAEGAKFLLDRQIPSGGWNYGNPGLNDSELLPFWDTTGLALVALRGRAEAARVRPSLEFLETNQEKIESPCGLAWAVMGLENWGRDAARLRTRLLRALAAASDETLNAAHLAAGLIALSGRKVFAP